MSEVKTLQEMKAEWEHRSSWLRQGKSVNTEEIWQMFEPYILKSEALEQSRNELIKEKAEINSLLLKCDREKDELVKALEEIADLDNPAGGIAARALKKG